VAGPDCEDTAYRRGRKGRTASGKKKQAPCAKGSLGGEPNSSDRGQDRWARPDSSSLPNGPGGLAERTKKENLRTSASLRGDNGRTSHRFATQGG